MADRARRTFGPIVMLGLAAAGLSAVASGKDWLWAAAGSVDTRDQAAGAVSSIGVTESPLAQALSLVVLAVWGVLLVTRGTFRRVLASFGLLVAIGTFVTAVLAPRLLTQPLVDDLRELSGGAEVEHAVTAWFVAAVVGTALSVVATALAVRFVASWPEMGTKYDRPDAASSSAEPETNLDLWKAIDEGKDPTA